jgi:hypothetical protein
MAAEGEVLSPGGETVDSYIQTCLTKYMVAAKAHRSNKRAVADWAHEMIVITRDVLEPAQVKDLVGVSANIHGEKLVEFHDESDEGPASSNL